MVKKIEDMFTHFDRIHDGQTDRQADTARRHSPRLCIASRDNNAAYVLTSTLIAVETNQAGCV